MNLETLPIPAFITVVLTLVSIVAIPVLSMAMSKTPLQSTSGEPDPPASSACDLPPSLDIGVKDRKGLPGSIPALDGGAPRSYKTATFAMG